MRRGIADGRDRWMVDGGGVEDDQVGLVAVVVVGEADEPAAVFAVETGRVRDEGHGAGVTAGPEVMGGPVTGAQVVPVHLGPAGGGDGPHVVGGRDRAGLVVPNRWGVSSMDSRRAPAPLKVQRASERLAASTPHRRRGHWR